VFVDDVAALPVAIASVARGGDVLITMGAGSIGTVPARLQQMLLETQA
jgi:UDP-N-acetylmuramate--alanine ligase